MKKSIRSLFFGFAILVSLSCGVFSTPVPPTFTPSPIPPTVVPTFTPEPTATSEPSPTPITYPSVLDQTFSNVQILYKDDFEYRIQGESPRGWISGDNTVLRVSKDNNVNISPRINTYGGGYFYGGKAINPGEGVFLSFQYTGTKNSFTWGLDNINSPGELFKYKTDGYFSFAMEMKDRYLSTHVIEGPNQKDANFEGSLKLLEGTWYNCLIALDKKQNYIIKVWEPNSPDNQLVYIRNVKNSPTAHYFVSWIGIERTLRIDEFTIFGFDDILLQ